MILEKRGPERPYSWKLLAGGTIIQWSLGYPTGRQYMQHLRQRLRGLADRWFRMRSRGCGSPSTGPTEFQTLDEPPATGQVEHPLPVSTTHCSNWLTELTIPSFSTWPAGLRARTGDDTVCQDTEPWHLMAQMVNAPALLAFRTVSGKTLGTQQSYRQVCHQCPQLHRIFVFRWNVYTSDGAQTRIQATLSSSRTRSTPPKVGLKSSERRWLYPDYKLTFELRSRAATTMASKRPFNDLCPHFAR